MKRRRFLQTLSAAALVPRELVAQPSPSTGATLLYDNRAVSLDRVRTDTANPAKLWVLASDLPRINEFELKPQGACRADLCIPVPKTMVNGEHFDFSAFAKLAGQAEVADTASRVWSYGEMPVLRGAFLESRMAPDFSVPDRQGRPVKLSDFRGKKVLVVTWASW
jgi:hypothetical protein